MESSFWSGALTKETEPAQALGVLQGVGPLVHVGVNVLGHGRFELLGDAQGVLTTTSSTCSMPPSSSSCQRAVRCSRSAVRM